MLIGIFCLTTCDYLWPWAATAHHEVPPFPISLPGALFFPPISMFHYNGISKQLSIIVFHVVFLLAISLTERIRVQLFPSCDRRPTQSTSLWPPCLPMNQYSEKNSSFSFLVLKRQHPSNTKKRVRWSLCIQKQTFSSIKVHNANKIITLFAPNTIRSEWRTVALNLKGSKSFGV